MILTRLVFSLTDQAPVFFHQINIGCSQSERDVNLSVGDALIDLEFGYRPSIDEHKEETAAALNAQRVQDHTSVFVELNQRSKSSVLGRIRREPDDIVLRNPRHLFDGHVFSRDLGANGRCERFAIPRVGLCVHPERAMSLFRDAVSQRKSQANREYTESLHAA